MDICLIPARSGSKRLKNKNITTFFGRPMISYPIKIALKSKLFNKVFVSTDSKKIAKISKIFGAETPFIRPKKLANDYATDINVLKHFISFIKKKGLNIRFLCYIYPVNPLLKVSTLKKCKKLLLNSKSEKIMTVGKFSYPIQRALKKNNISGDINFKENTNKGKRSQDLEAYYHDAAQCYWFDLRKIKNIADTKIKTKAILLKNFEFLDVDTHEDLTNLKKIYKYNLQK
jgi:pseudaminic acid cytidylyltransferase